MNTTQTFIKSCEHWSEHYREEMQSFYKLAGLDYFELANSLKWSGIFLNIKKKLDGRPLEILDVACGSGMFPTALQKVLSDKDKKISIHYSLLDPSKFAITETKKRLSRPFQLNKEFNMTLQDFNCKDALFHISWAIHALYAVPKSEFRNQFREVFQLI